MINEHDSDDDEIKNEYEDEDLYNPADILEVPRLSSCLGCGQRGGREIQVDNLQFEIKRCPVVGWKKNDAMMQ